MKNTAAQITRLGLKVTPQRVGVLKFLEGNRTHPTVETIYLELIEKYPGISHTTVYNTLTKLVEAGMVRELHVDPHRRRFDPCTDPHDHFYCRVCGSVYDVDYEEHSRESIVPENQLVDGHRIETIEMSLQGVCRNCEGGKVETKECGKGD